MKNADLQAEKCDGVESRRGGTRMTRHRRSRIADLTREQGVVRVAELADHLGVSEVTIRADLAQLERDGQLIRDRGGAIPTDEGGALRSLLAFEQRAILNLEAKTRIARVAAQMVEPGDTILLDAGTTTGQMPQFLSKVPGLTVVTNAFNVAHEMSGSDAQLLFLGGTVNRTASSTLGPLTEQGLSGLVVSKLFIGTQALNLEDGLTDTTMEIAQVKRAMIAAARQVILLTDSSKWNRSGFIKVAPLSAVHTLICDEGLSEEARVATEKAGVKLIIAQ